MNVLNPITAALLLASSPSVLALDSPDHQGSAIETMVITASRMQEDIASIPGSVHVITHQQLTSQLSAGASLADAIAQLIPGVSMPTQVRTNFSQNIRGRKILVLIDGLPLAENRSIARDLDSIMASNIERVEVISGASAVYGAGGTGGIINIITQSAAQQAEGWQGQTTLAASQFSAGNSDSMSLRLHQQLSVKQQAWDVLLSAAIEQRGNHRDGSGEIIAPEPAQTSRSDADSRELIAKLGYDLNADSRISLQYQNYQDQQDSDYGPNYGGPSLPALRRLPVAPDAVPGLQLAEQPLTRRQSWLLNAHHANFAGHYWRALAFHRSREFRFFPFPQVVKKANPYNLVVNQSTSESSVDGIKLTAEWLADNQWQWVYGLDWQNERGVQWAHSYQVLPFIQSGGLHYQPEGQRYDYGPNVDTQSSAVFVQSKWQLNDSWSARLGARHEWINAKVHDSTPILETFYANSGLIPAITPLTGATLDYQATLFSAAIMQQFTEQQQWFANYSEGFELPDVARLLRNALAPNSPLVQLGVAGGTVIADSQLAAVKVQAVELGWRWQSEQWHAQVSLFANESAKTPVFNADYSVSILDQNKRFVGAELQLQWQFAPNWQADISYSHSQGKTQTTQGWQYLDASEMAPNKITGQLSVDADQWGRWQLQALHSASDRRAASQNPQHVALVSFTTVDLLGQWTWHEQELRLAVRNLFDKHYQTVYSQWAGNIYGSFAALPAPGRSIAIEWSWQY